MNNTEDISKVTDKLNDLVDNAVSIKESVVAMIDAISTERTSLALKATNISKSTEAVSANTKKMADIIEQLKVKVQIQDKALHLLEEHMKKVLVDSIDNTVETIRPLYSDEDLKKIEDYKKYLEGVSFIDECIKEAEDIILGPETEELNESPETQSDK